MWRYGVACKCLFFAAGPIVVVVVVVVVGGAPSHVRLVERSYFRDEIRELRLQVHDLQTERGLWFSCGCVVVQLCVGFVLERFLHSHPYVCEKGSITEFILLRFADESSFHHHSATDESNI